MDNPKTLLKKVISTRRSTRNYRPDEVLQELLDEVIEAGRLAPSGNNNQTTHFIVVKTPEVLSEMRVLVTNILAAMQVREGMPTPLVGLINRAKKEIVDVGYGAPVLILVANKKNYNNAMADCSCAMENMMLTAAVNGLGSCWINQYFLLRDLPLMREFMEKLGLLADEDIYAALVLGYSDRIETEPLPRKGNIVTYV